LSAAIFNGNTDAVEYTDLSASDRFIALAEGEVDVLSRLTTVTLERDILEPSAGVGFTFSQPNFYDGLIFGGIPPYASCADTLDVTSTSCSDLLICVIEGTTFETVLQTLFPDRFVVPRASVELSVEGLVSGDCNVIAGGVVDVSLTNIRLAGYDGSYQTGSTRYSKDPLAMVTRQDDVVWSNFVYWIVASTIYAEEQGITQSTASDMPEVSLFGPLYTDMFRLAIGAVGNYGEIYERQAEAEVPRGGLNDLYLFNSGGLLYPLPGVIA
jgi:general L-amino acid transport system substrate-binding protein